MFKRFLPITLLSYVSIVIVNWGCTKLDTTSLGSDLIPAVDNVNTFADTLDIITTQGIFNDTFKIGRAENHALGLISNDPLFGSTDARIYLQPKPPSYPYFLGNAGDTIVALDSIVLSLSYKGAWGDTSIPQQIRVHSIDDLVFADSVYKKPQTIGYTPNLGNLLGSASVNVTNLKNVVKFNNGKDSSTNQVRIKLSDAYRDYFFANRDTVPTSLSNALRSDSLFRKFHNGFAISSTAGNALMYINLTDVNTRLELYVRKKNSGTGKLDTTYNSFGILSASSNIAYITPSATSNFVSRSYPANVLNPGPGELYLQSGPGTYVNLSIPGLTGMPNRIIHRAQISIEQIPENATTDSIFSIPSYMYLDLIDTGTTTKWKPLYVDLNPNTRYDPDFKTGLPYFPNTGEIDYNYFGGYSRKKTNAVGTSVYYYDLNVTRYVQQMVTKGLPNYAMRLFPGFSTQYPQYGFPYYPSISNPASLIPLDNPLAVGRIKVKSGNFPDPDKKQKMRMTIIWSKL